jgi:hypothetical protein
VSLLYELENGSSAEIAVVGCEGIVGIALFMGGEVISAFITLCAAVMIDSAPLPYAGPAVWDPEPACAA